MFTFWARWIFKVLPNTGGEIGLSEQVLNQSGQMPTDKQKSRPLVWPCWLSIMFLEAKSWHGRGSGIFVIHPLWHSLWSLFLFWVWALTTKVLHLVCTTNPPAWFSYWALSWIQGGTSLFSFLQQHGGRGYAVFSSQSFLHCNRYKFQGISPSICIPTNGFHKAISCLCHVSHQEFNDMIRVKMQASKTQ